MTPGSALLTALRESSLLPPDQLREAERLAATLPSAGALTEALVGRGWLTAYQADELSARRGAALVIGSYVLLERLGKGGMGEVFRARHRVMEREVALKRVKEDLLDSPELVARFLREVKATARLSHPNVVQVFDAGEAGGVHFLAMELLRGVNLAEYLARRGPLPVAEAVDYVRQACVGMQHAHESGLVHRDLKPANLWLTQQRQVKILDLGLALLSHADTLTQGGGFFGTVDYIAPEQVTDSHGVDIRADVYSLGCTLFQLLAGKAPFAAAHPAARPSMHLNEEPPPLERCRADVPPAVAAVVGKMMAKKREDRYQTPGEAAAALAALTGRGDATERSTLLLPPVTQAPSTLPHGQAPARPSEQSTLPLTPRRAAGKVTLLTVVLGGLLLLGGVTALVVPPLLRGGKTGGDPKNRAGPLSQKMENSIGMKFVRLPKGKFLMGSPEDDRGRSIDERPHEVTLTKDFHLGTYEVTQRQYQTVMGKNPSHFCAEGGGKDRVKGMDTSDFPVECVSWRDAQEFLKRLNEREKETLNGWEYRLPTEAEWEYACRAGAASKNYHFGDSLDVTRANFADANLNRPVKVGSYPANEFGLYDMHGNVGEWCEDWFDKGYHPEGGDVDPTGPSTGTLRVFRGGSWTSWVGNCRCASRHWLMPGGQVDEVGFRVALAPVR